MWRCWSLDRPNSPWVSLLVIRNLMLKVSSKNTDDASPHIIYSNDYHLHLSTKGMSVCYPPFLWSCCSQQNPSFFFLSSLSLSSLWLEKTNGETHLERFSGWLTRAENSSFGSNVSLEWKKTRAFLVLVSLDWTINHSLGCADLFSKLRAYTIQ